MLSSVGYVSAVSGGAWAAVPFTYYAGDASTDTEMLGAHLEPEQLTLEQLDRLDPRHLGHAATLDFRRTLDDAQHTDDLGRRE